MKNIFKLFSAGVLVLIAAGSRAEDMGVSTQTVTEPPPAASSMSLEDLSVGTAIQDRALQGAGSAFSASVGRLYCFNRVIAQDAPTTVTHIWKKDGVALGEVTLNIGGNPWRTWSNHAVEPGSWTVEVHDASGALVDTVAFTVSEASAAPATPAASTDTTGGY